MKIKKTLSVALGLSFFLAIPIQSLAQETTEENGGGEVTVPDKKKPKSICYSEAKKNVLNFVNNLIPDVCANINTDPDLENSKYMYQNPDGGCDIGLELPGLPSFGGGLSGVSSCQIVKAVTGDMVDKVNEGVNGAWDGALDTVKGKISEKTGLDVDNLNFDMGAIAEDAIKGESFDDALRNNTGSSPVRIRNGQSNREYMNKVLEDSKKTSNRMLRM